MSFTGKIILLISIVVTVIAMVINPAIHYTNYTAYAIFGCLK